VKLDERAAASRTYVRDKKCIQSLDGNEVDRRPFGRLTVICEDNIKMGFEEIISEDVDWI
jgi:hypothetical protein